MRYVIAMVVAVLGAGAMMLFVSGEMAATVVKQFRFESPDDVENVHAAVFMGLNIVGLAAGWIVGWAIGGTLGGPKRAQ
jgi:hypothetical protein